MRSYVAVHRAALPLRLLVPRRRLAARGARGGGDRPRPRCARAHRPRLAVGVDGVRAGGEVAGPAGDPWGGGHARRRAPSHAARPRRDGLAQPLPAADPRPRPYARRPAARPLASRPCRSTTSRRTTPVSSASAAARAAACATSRRCAACSSVFGRDGFRVELQRPLAAPRPGAEPRAGGARRRGSASRPSRPATSTRTRATAPTCRTPSWRSASTRRSTPPSRCGAATTRTCSRARRRWRPASPTIPMRSPRPGGWRQTLTLRPHERPRLPLSRRRGSRWPVARWPRSARRASTSATRAAARTTRRPRRAWRRSCASSTSSASRASFSCIATCSSSRARSRVEVRGTRQCPLAAAARPRARLERLVDRLPSHRPQPRRPDRQQAPARALPQRGAHRAAGHRPRLPARRAREAHPARARALRHGALGARRGLPDLPRARRDPRARQGARAAAGRDRARRARQRGLVVASRSTATSTSRSGRDGGPGAGSGSSSSPTRPTGCRAISPSTRAG